MTYNTQQELMDDLMRGLTAGELDPGSAETAGLLSAATNPDEFKKFKAEQDRIQRNEARS